MWLSGCKKQPTKKNKRKHASSCSSWTHTPGCYLVTHGYKHLPMFFFLSPKPIHAQTLSTSTEHIHQRESYRKPILNLDKIALAGWISYSCTSPTGLPPVTDRRSHLQPGEASWLIRQGLWGAQKIAFHAGKEMCLCLLCQHVRRHKPPLPSHTRKVILCFSLHLWDGFFSPNTCIYLRPHLIHKMRAVY